MKRAVALIGLALVLGGCLGPDAIAADNQTDELFYLRYEGQWAWEVPPRTSGIGPTDVGWGNKQVEILREDCSTAAGWGFGGRKTITIQHPSGYDWREPTLSGGVSVRTMLAPTDTCALR